MYKVIYRWGTIYSRSSLARIIYRVGVYRSACMLSCPSKPTRHVETWNLGYEDQNLCQTGLSAVAANTEEASTYLVCCAGGDF